MSRVCCEGGPLGPPYYGHAGDCPRCIVKLPRAPDKHDRADLRPWPVNPRKYPLSGPIRGPVHTPRFPNPHDFDLDNEPEEHAHSALYWLSVALVAAFIVLGVAAPILWPDMTDGKPYP